MDLALTLGFLAEPTFCRECPFCGAIMEFELPRCEACDAELGCS